MPAFARDGSSGHGAEVILLESERILSGTVKFPKRGELTEDWTVKGGALEKRTAALRVRSLLRAGSATLIVVADAITFRVGKSSGKAGDALGAALKH